MIAVAGALEQELPLRAAGLNVTFTDDLRPYRERKVRILNGAHTMTALAAFLAGHDTVRDCMQDPVVFAYVDRGIHEEILPTLELPRQELHEFAASVLERFDNPFIRHHLSSIALNSVSKYRARILPTVTDYVRARGTLPRRLTFALAALIAFYRGQTLEEGALVGERSGVPIACRTMPRCSSSSASHGPAPRRRTPQSFSELVRRTLARSRFLGQRPEYRSGRLQRSGLRALAAILRDGMRAALERVA